MSKKIIDIAKKAKESLRLKSAKTNKVYKNLVQAEIVNHLIRSFLVLDTPLMISRFGSTEAACTDFFLRKRPKQQYKDWIRNQMINNSGFFPADDLSLDKFAQLNSDSIKQVDLLGVWYPLGETKIIQNLCPEAYLVPLYSLEPYFHKNPWSYLLKGKRVLVVHPFAESIQENFLNSRNRLFKDPQTLPDFDLQVFKAVQSMGGDCNFNNWFDAFDYMRDEISKREFEIAIIGCGAYGLPLAAFVKDLGKKAIHLGGATQILFGIRGQRWDTKPFFQSLFNEFWTSPQASEIPDILQQNQIIRDYW
ncbi:hypothetical protein [Pleurocapsa sp. FMAR1]|uniref:hypothetical protein n=1 Tax=Pleurocapsa sp. FMAR1 TaxID=3040204 RepID=UPI0029C87399|nr:hypothetical protein [Pleurocapsa sp. FMAR1]